MPTLITSKIRLEGCRAQLFALAIVVLSGCTASHSGTDRDKYSGAFFVAQAVAAADRIEQPSNSAVAASELARAFADIGERDRAQSMLQGAMNASVDIAAPASRAKAQVALLLSAAEIGLEQAADIIDAALQSSLTSVDDETRRSDLIGRAIVARATLGEPSAGLAAALSMPVGTESLEAYRSRTLHDLAPLLASSASRDEVNQALAGMSEGLKYYQASAFADVAKVFSDTGDSTSAAQMLAYAESVARAETNGYFIAGALRRIGGVYAATGDPRAAELFWSAATAAAELAESDQERARAISRIATTMADFGQYDQARETLAAAIAAAEVVPSPALQAWTYYEIAGSAAFAGDLETATALSAQIPAELEFAESNIANATRRDVAFGLARHGRYEEAYEHARTILGARERAQAFARIARVIANPDLKAYPRYL